MARAPAYDRDKTLAAAKDLFWRKGYHATSLKDLEAALQMRPGSIYAAFTSKEALFRETLRLYYESECAVLRDRIALADDPLAEMTGYLRGMAGQPRHGRACMLVKTVLECATAATELGATAREYLDGIQEEYRAIFAAAQGRGEIAAREDPARLARAFQSKMIALSVEVQRGTRGPDLAALADDMVAEVLSVRAG